MEFMRKNFYDEKYHDTVYITANPNIENFSDKIFHKIYKTYDYRGSPEPRGFFPSKVYDDVIDAFERYPNKRLLIHFMQPHAPYIGGKAKKLYNELKESHGISIERHAKMFDTDLTDNVYSTWHHVADDGYIDNSQLWELYMENLHIGMEQALKTIRKLEGKTLITSDHGELLGEDSRFGLPPGYGHPKKVYHEKLRIVPWYIIDSDVRRTTISETPKMSNDINEETVKEHLRALGYK
jgi:hypothetical protein